MSNFKHYLKIGIFAGATMAFAGGAGAAEHAVYMKDLAFSQRVIDVNAGDTVKFVNAGSDTHTLYSLTPDQFFSTDNMVPGAATTVKFSRTGKVEVHCARFFKSLHLTVNVKKPIVQSSLAPQHQ